jgi:type I restriction enzyme S subunit
METKELPKGWGLRELNTFAKIVMGQSPSSKTYNESKNGLPFFQGKKEFGKINPVPVKWCSSPLRIAEKGDILMSVRAPVGALNVSTEKCCIGRGLCAIRANKLVLQEYLWHYLKLKEKEFSFQGRGTTFDSISKDDVYSYEVPIPFPNDKEKSLKIQKQIVAKLDAFFKEYELLKEEKEKAQENYDKILQNAFSKLIESQKEESKVKIGDLVNEGIILEIKSGFPSGLHSKSGELIHMRPMNINLKGEMDLSNCKYVNPVNEKIEAYLLNNGDVIFNNTNSPELVGKTTVFHSTEKCLFSNHMTRIRVDTKKINPKFLAKYLHTLWQSGLFKVLCRNHVSQASINNSMFKEVEIYLPDIKAQDKIVSVIDGLKKPIEAIQNERISIESNINHLPHSVLSKAFAGELV